jgi:TetR/AcrR family transcriptional regulator, transcriptional repressor for nem operon
MRVTREKAAENRERILAAAARLFRRHGFGAAGVDAVMHEAGLTHGGFYGHFPSKDALAAAAVRRAWAGSVERQAAHADLDALVRSYLAPAHRDDPGGGCVIAALGGDAARQAPGVRRALTEAVDAQLDRLAELLGGGAAARQGALATLSTLVGALVLSRAVDDPALSDAILDAAREGVGLRGPGAAQ